MIDRNVSFVCPMNRLSASIFLLALLSAGAFAASVASDNATNSAYAGNNWAAASNGGSGFGAWSFTTTGTAGRYIGGTALGSTTFGIWAVSGAGNGSYALRPFTGTMTSGQTFSVTLAHTTTIDTGASVGLSLMDGGTGRITLKFTGGTSAWTLNDGGSDFAIGQNYAANTPLTFSFTYNGGSSYSYSFGSASGLNYTAAVSLTNLNGVNFFNNYQGNSQNLGFNDLALVPEPSTYALLGVSGLAFCGYFIRRRRR